MELLNIDVGLKSYQLVEGGEPLRFNPSDPNVSARYTEALDEIKAVEKEMSERAAAISAADDSMEAQVEAGKQSLLVMMEGDAKIKSILNGVFGGRNDFDKILHGINLLAITSDGDRVITKVVEALSPILQSGAKSFADTEVKAAKLNREQRRAMGL